MSTSGFTYKITIFISGIPNEDINPDLCHKVKTMCLIKYYAMKTYEGVQV
jgi:hypothetical protein